MAKKRYHAPNIDIKSNELMITFNSLREKKDFIKRGMKEKKSYNKLRKVRGVSKRNNNYKQKFDIKNVIASEKSKKYQLEIILTKKENKEEKYEMVALLMNLIPKRFKVTYYRPHYRKNVRRKLARIAKYSVCCCVPLNVSKKISRCNCNQKQPAANYNPFDNNFFPKSIYLKYEEDLYLIQLAFRKHVWKIRRLLPA